MNSIGLGDIPNLGSKILVNLLLRKASNNYWMNPHPNRQLHSRINYLFYLKGFHILYTFKNPCNQYPK